MSIKIYVACLASYNNGVLHGRWIDASSDVDEMREEVNAMLRDSRFPNVEVDCPQCHGVGTQTFHNSETGDIRQGDCLVCGGKGVVPSAEEFAIHDSEGLPKSFGEYSGLQAVADFVELVESLEWLDDSDVAEIVDEFGDTKEAESALDDSFAGIYDSFRDYADECADEQIACFKGGDGVEWISRYFDYESFAAELQHDMRTIELSDGRVAVFYA
jgi:antirestriction protein